MPDDVQAPGIGKVPKQWVFVGLAAVGGIVAYAWWRNRQTAVEPINPDALPEDRVPPDTVEVGTGVSESAGRPLTNSEWAQAATDRMVELGYDTVTVSSAIGKYLSRQPLSGDEATLIRTVLGQLGPPPDGDFPVTLAPSGSTTPPPTTTVGHKYVVQLHQIAVNTPVRDLVERFSSTDPAVATGNNIQTATVRTQADPRNIGDIRAGIALKQHAIYVTTVQRA